MGSGTFVYVSVDVHIFLVAAEPDNLHWELKRLANNIKCIETAGVLHLLCQMLHFEYTA